MAPIITRAIHMQQLLIAQSLCVQMKLLIYVYNCRLCFMKLKLLLIAVGINNSIAINPGIAVKIQSASQGFFIAQSANEVKRQEVILFMFYAVYLLGMHFISR